MPTLLDFFLRAKRCGPKRNGAWMRPNCMYISGFGLQTYFKTKMANSSCTVHFARRHTRSLTCCHSGVVTGGGHRKGAQRGRLLCLLCMYTRAAAIMNTPSNLLHAGSREAQGYLPGEPTQKSQTFTWEDGACNRGR